VIVGGVQSQIPATGVGYSGSTCSTQTSGLWCGPVGVATDSSDNIYIAQYSASQIVKIDANTHTPAVVLGTGSGATGVGHPQQMAMDSSNNLFIADPDNDRIVKYSTTTNAVVATYPIPVYPFAVGVDSSNNAWIGAGGALYEIPSGTGSGTAAVQKISAATTGLSSIWGIAFDTGGNMWVANNPDPNNQGLATGSITEFTAASSFATKNTVFTSSTLYGPGQIVFDSSNNMYVAEDNSDSVVKFIYSSGYTYGYSAAASYPLSTAVPSAEAVALDNKGNLFLTAYADGVQANSKVIEISTQTASFGTQNVGTTSASVSFNFNVLAGTTVGSWQVVDQGLTGLEFNQASSGSTCTTGSYASATSCVIMATFTPKYPGVRYGAVKALDGSGNVLATAYVSGIGLAPLAGFSPGTVSVPTITGLTLNGPRRPVFDPAGNLYVADLGNNRVVKIAPSGAATVVATPGLTLSQPNAVALDGAGNLYIADGGNNRVVEVTAAGTASALNNNGLSVGPIGLAIDGEGDLFVSDNASARLVEYPIGGLAKVIYTGLNDPHGVAVDGSNNIFVANNGANQIVEITNGVGSVVSTGSVTLNAPHAVTLDSPGNIYVSDTGNNRMVEIPAGGGTAVVLGMGTLAPPTGSSNPPLYEPVGAAVSGAGDLYVMDAGNNRIVVSSQETPPALTFPTPTLSGVADGSDDPLSFTLLNLGNEALTIASADFLNVTPAGLTSFTNDSSTSCTGSLAANSSCVYGVDFIPAAAGSNTGTLTLTDNTLNVTGSTQAVSLNGTGIATSAPNEPVGTPSPTQTGALSFTSNFTLGSISVVTQGYTGLDFQPTTGGTCLVGQTYSSGQSCTVDYTFTPTVPGERLGAILLYDNSATPKLVATQYLSGVGFGPVLQFQPGEVSTSAGVGVACSGGACGDGGQATAANISGINSIVFDAAGNTYLIDINSDVVRKVTPAGVISTVVGTENSACASPTSACGDGGPGTSSLLRGPSKAAIDGVGNMYISDKGDNRVRVFNVISGTINAFAGTGNTCGSPAPGSCGDGGSALSAQLASVDGLAVDIAGNVYIGDTNDHEIRKVNIATGIISTIAGTGATCTTGVCGNGGLATAAQIAYPNEIHFDTAGNLYITDSTANRLRLINMTTGIISNIAGSGNACSVPTGACGDGGPANSAQMSTIWGFSLDGASNIYIVDNGDNKIRFVNASTGNISTVMGTGVACSSPTAACGDGGNAASATMNYPATVVFDPQGNVLVSDVTDRRIRKLTFAASNLSYLTTFVGSTSTDSPKSVTMVNAGNAALSFPAPSTGSNPSIAAGYTLDTTSANPTTCPNVAAGGSAGSLAVGGSCIYSINFAPVAPGTDSGSLVLTDNDLGVTPSTQTISLTGIGISPVAQLAWGTLPATTLTAGGNTGTVLVDEQDGSGNTVTSATDSITLTVTGPSGYTATYTVTAVAGVATFNLSSDLLTATGGYQYVATATVYSNPLSTSTAPETVTAAAPASIAASGYPAGGNVQTIGLGYGSSFSVLVSDQYGNPVPSAVVTFSSPSSGASAVLAGSPATTGASGATLGIATITGTANAIAGSFNVTATVSGVSGSVLFAVTNNQGPTTTSIGALPATPIVYGSSTTTLKSLVASSTTSAIPTGSVALANNGTTLTGASAVALSSGSTTFTTPYLTAGSYSFTAKYSGDANFLTSTSGAAGYVVNKAPVTLTASNSQTVTALSTAPALNLTITGASVGAGILVPGSAGGGAVACNFYNSSSVLVATTTGTVTAGSSNSAASCPVPSAASTTVGSYSVTVAFNGDSNYLASAGGTNGVGGNSLNFPYTVIKATPTVGLTALPATPIVYGSSQTTLNSAVTASAGSPTGSVVLSNNSTPLGAAITLASGSASYTSYFTAGSYSFTSAYSGDATFQTASSVAVPYVVSKAPVTITASSAQTVPALGSTSTLNLTITGASVGTGILVPGSGGGAAVTCNFYNSSSTLVGSSTATVVAGSASSSAACPVPAAVTNTVGSYSVTAGFNGDSNYLVSGAGTGGGSGNSLNFPFTVQPVTPAITWSPSASALTVTYGTLLGGTLTPSASYASSSVPGTFTYTASSVGTVNASSVLSVGVYTLTATFTPTSSDYTTNTAKITYTVIPATPTVALTSTPNPVYMLSTVSYTATVTGVTNGVTPQGTVTFFDGTASLGTATLNASGVATVSAAPQVAGTHPITAVYAGNTFYNTATSNILNEVAQDFTVAVASGGTGTATVNPGGTATYTLVVSPTVLATFPGPVTLTTSGGPAGATITLSPTTVAGGASATNLTLTVVTANSIVQNTPESLGRKLAPLSLAFLLLPLVGFRRGRKAWQRYLSVLLLLAGSLGAVTALSGCNSVPSGYFGQAPKSFTITVTGTAGTAGTLTHSTSVTLTIE
jgi:sugar lactone lactonase YvrE